MGGLWLKYTHFAHKCQLTPAHVNLQEDRQMADGNTPDGVDPALWADFKQLSDRIHELHRQRELEEVEVTPRPPTFRMMLDVPEEWFLLFAWIDGRERHRRHGKDGETGLSAEGIVEFGAHMRRLVSRYMWRTLNDHFHAELHELATGQSHLLRPVPEVSPEQSPS
jgi:hypothetical protein